MSVARTVPPSLLPLLQLLLLLLATTCCQARIGRSCHSPSLKKYFQHGDEWTESTCRRGRCLRGLVLLEDCPPLIESGPPSRCTRRPGNEGASFPDCCPWMECHRPGADKPCFNSRLNRHFAVGESWSGSGCSRVTCTSNGIGGVGCGSIGVPPGHPCSFNAGNSSLWYPECCPKLTCPDCYSERLDRFFGPGETWTEAGCVSKQCKVSTGGNRVLPIT